MINSKSWLFAIIAVVTLSGCAPGFTLRATTEEYKILSQKESLETLLQQKETSEKLRDKFQLVIAAREFAAANGLKPQGSFSEYADIKREVLVWVLSAAPQTSLEAYSWWFPIVGSVPYKGFFDEAEAKSYALNLKAQGYDIFLRPSPAFSTLGWFKDPLLSTYINFDDVNLVATVFHEIFHNTVWIPGDAFFNETAANVVGYLFAAAFFESRQSMQLAAQARDLLADELRFSAFLDTLHRELQLSFDNKQLNDAQKRASKEKILQTAQLTWNQQEALLKTQSYKNAVKQLNNAVIIAFRIYLLKPNLFIQLYEKDTDLKRFVEKFAEIKQRANKEQKSPYLIVEKMLTE